MGRPEGQALHEHMASSFGYSADVPACVLIAHLMMPLLSRYDEFHRFVYLSQGHDNTLNQREWPSLFLKAVRRKSVIQDVCRCIWGWNADKETHTFGGVDLMGAGKDTVLHWKAPSICVASEAGRQALNQQPVNGQTSASEGYGQHYGLIRSQIQRLFEWARTQHR